MNRTISIIGYSWSYPYHSSFWIRELSPLCLLLFGHRIIGMGGLVLYEEEEKERKKTKIEKTKR
jgi:hypothetical protein